MCWFLYAEIPTGDLSLANDFAAAVIKKALLFSVPLPEWLGFGSIKRNDL